MTTLPKETPVWIEDLIRSARMLALDFAGKPDEEVRLDLEGIIGNIEADIVGEIGAKQAATLLDIFRRAVMGHKHDIENAGASGSLSEFLEVVSR
jgi:hypothetical protein